VGVDVIARDLAGLVDGPRERADKESAARIGRVKVGEIAELVANVSVPGARFPGVISDDRAVALDPPHVGSALLLAGHHVRIVKQCVVAVGVAYKSVVSLRIEIGSGDHPAVVDAFWTIADRAGNV